MLSKLTSLFSASDVLPPRPGRRTTAKQALEVLESRQLFSAGAILLGDLNQSPRGSSPGDFMEVGGKTVFTADGSGIGRELFATNGSGSGTMLLKDINAGPDGAGIANMTLMGTKVYFTANDVAHGNELWQTDGTEAGTVLVKDIKPGFASSFVRNLTVVGTTLFFTADDGDQDRELWKSDGTQEGTVRVADLNAGSVGSYPDNLVVLGSTLYFAANSSFGRELYSTDGTTVSLVRDINQGTAGSNPDELTVLGGRIYFAATQLLGGADLTVSSGRELWVTDGTSNGTRLVKDIRPGGDFITDIGTGITTGSPFSSDPHNFFVSEERLFFQASNSAVQGAPGTDFFSTDGTAGGTVYASPRVPRTAVALNGASFDLRTTSPFQNGLPTIYRWDDGILSSIYDGVSGESLQTIQVLGDRLFVLSRDDAGYSFIVSDGTRSGTRRATTSFNRYATAPGLVGAIGEQILFAAYGDQGYELWISDGTPESTVLLSDINPGTKDTVVRGYNYPIASANGHLFLIADNTDGDPSEPYGAPYLWESNGTATEMRAIAFQAHEVLAVGDRVVYTAEGGALLAAFTPGSGSAHEILPSFVANPSTMVVSDDGQTLYFSGADSTLSTGYELFKTDGTQEGTILIADINSDGSSNPFAFTEVNGVEYFFADDGTHGTELWKTDGTNEGTTLVKDIHAAGSSVFSTLSYDTTSLNETLFFVANDGVHGNELWKSDGTSHGTVRVADIVPGAGDSSPFELTPFAGRVWFSVSMPSGEFDFIEQLWTTDGTDTGTQRFPAFEESMRLGPADLTVVGELLYFTSSEGLYVTDGTVSGTVLLTSNGGWESDSYFDDFRPVGNRLYFTLYDEFGILAVWTTDGTVAGTTPLPELGVVDSYDSTLYDFDGSLFFMGDTATEGAEPRLFSILTGSADGAFTVGQSPIAVAPEVVVSDVVQKTIAAFDVTISNHARGQDVLSFNSDAATMGNIKADFDPATGIMRLSSPDRTATPSQFQAALRAVTYQNTNDDPDTTDRSLVIQMTEGAFAGDTSNRLLSTIKVNAFVPIPGITVIPSSGLEVSELGAQAMFTVVLDTEPTDEVTIELWSSDPTEGTIDHSTLTFTVSNWNVAQTVTVTGVDDTIDDADVVFNVITAAAVGGNYTGVDSIDVEVTNIDDDDPATNTGDVDGDTDFDANDAFLISLIKLGGTDVQIDQSKGTSTKTANEIRTAINALFADVDGDSDTDANDAFLIQLVKLGGADSQINQTKGASPITAAEIRTRVTALGNPATTASTSLFSRTASTLHSSVNSAASNPDKKTEIDWFPSENSTLSLNVAELNLHEEVIATLVWTGFREWIDSI